MISVRPMLLFYTKVNDSVYANLSNHNLSNCDFKPSKSSQYPIRVRTVWFMINTRYSSSFEPCRVGLRTSAFNTAVAHMAVAQIECNLEFDREKQNLILFYTFIRWYGQYIKLHCGSEVNHRENFSLWRCHREIGSSVWTNSLWWEKCQTYFSNTITS